MRIKLKVFASTAKTRDGHEFPIWYTYDVKDNRYAVKSAKASGITLPSYNFTLTVDPRGLYVKKDANGYNTIYVMSGDATIEKLETEDRQNLGELFEAEPEEDI